MLDLKLIGVKLLEGNSTEVERLTKEALAQNYSATKILNGGLIAGMDIVGEKFKNNEIFIPEVLLAARAMQAGMNVLQPLLAGEGVKPIAKVAIGTVKGDLHDIGKNLVATMLKGAGFEILDFGIDTHPEKFVNSALKDGIKIIAMSALLTTSMPSMKETIEQLKKAGLLDKVKTMIGGAPVTEEYAQQIGADGYAPDAATAVDKAKELLGVK